MEITVLKCDRCKRETDGLIEFSLINRNVEEETPAEEATNGIQLWSVLYKKSYPTISGGLCFDCVKELIRWLGHQENSLLKTGL